MGTGKKRPILLWQMIVLVVLPLTVIVSAFFPRISISDGKIVDAYKDVYESVTGAISGVAGGLLGESGLDDLMGDHEEEVEEIRENLEGVMKHDISFTGWEIMFLSDEMIIEKFLHMTGQDETLDQKEMDKMIEDSKDQESKMILSAIEDFLGYMKVGYVILYITCLLLIIMSVLWFVFKWDGVVLIFTNIAVSLYGSIATILGILNMGKNALDSLSDAVGLGGIFGSASSMIEGLGDADQLMDKLTEPLRVFSIAINRTFGGLGCMIVCVIMFLFALYMLIDHFTLAKRRLPGAGPAAAGALSGRNPFDPMPGQAPMPSGMSPMPGQIPMPSGRGTMPGAYESPSLAADRLAAAALPVGRIMVTRGEFQGAEVAVRDGEEVILGRDPAVCHLVFQNSKISRKHCGIKYNPNTNTYFVKNYSMNGTSFASGQSISSDVFVEVAPGNIIQLAEGREEIALG